MFAVHIAWKSVHWLGNGIRRRVMTEAATSLKFTAVDLRIQQNTKGHHTDEYEITGKPKKEEGDHWEKPQLVVRRGQSFSFALSAGRKFDPTKDSLHLILKATGYGKASPADGTSHRLTVQPGNITLKPREWGVTVAKSGEKEVVFRVMAACDCPVGRWKIMLESSVKDQPDVEKQTCAIADIYILFNAWCKEDQVHMADDDLRDEYVMNDSGKIFAGSYWNIRGKPWNFAQFEDVMLDATLELLDKVKMKLHKRGNPVEVCRALSAIVNCQDDDGLLAGNWSGDYEGGTSPLDWAGSHDIMKEYWKSKGVVCWAQCWVFSGVCTSLARALGLPSRSVTNFASAHDTDGNCVLEKIFVNGDFKKGWHGDSIWNFHVWNEGWMTRPDLGPNYGGWQAFDATPQEESPYNRVNCAGPASVKAIKEGDVNIPYDGRFIFAEVNGDEVHLNYKDEWMEELVTKTVKKRTVGKNISTHQPRKVKFPSNNWSWDRFLQRLDVTDQYKYEEGSAEERRAVRRAAMLSADPDVYDEVEEPEVTFELTLDREAKVGDKFNIVLNINNTSDAARTVETTIVIDATRYTNVDVGVAHGRITKKAFKTSLGNNQGETLTYSVKLDEYLPKMTPEAAFHITAVSHVLETDSWNSEAERYMLGKPDLELTLPERAYVGETIYMTVTFNNPLPVPLTECKMKIEGAGLQKPSTQTIGDVRAKGHWNVNVPITPKRKGDMREVIASFSSKELKDVKGSASIMVLPQ